MALHPASVGADALLGAARIPRIARRALLQRGQREAGNGGLSAFGAAAEVKSSLMRKRSAAREHPRRIRTCMPRANSLSTSASQLVSENSEPTPSTSCASRRAASPSPARSTGGRAQGRLGGPRRRLQACVGPAAPLTFTSQPSKGLAASLRCRVHSPPIFSKSTSHISSSHSQVTAAASAPPCAAVLTMSERTSCGGWQRGRGAAEGRG